MGNSLRYVSYKDKKVLAADLKTIYHATTVDAARQALDAFSDKWDVKYAQISKSWRNHWENLIIIFDYPPEIRLVYLTINGTSKNCHC